MLFGYSIEATHNNWLHECLCDMLHAIHDALDAGTRPLVWPTNVPTNYRAILQPLKGLRKRLEAYERAMASLSKQERDLILLALEEQNDISGLVSHKHDCSTIDALPANAKMPIRDLFGFAFELLTDLGIRDSHFKTIYRRMPHKICPFCGYEFFGAPGGKREALDHYLAESIYPLAGANLRNLVPMGHKCNSQYKRSQDMLWSSNGTRRVSIDPYMCDGIAISLMSSEPFGGGEDGLQPKWQIGFEPACSEAATWDEVFSIRLRYTTDVLAVSYSLWLTGFRVWFRHKFDPRATNDDDIATALEEYAVYLDLSGEASRDFLRVPVFRMLHKHCQEGNHRLLTFLRDLITMT